MAVWLACVSCASKPVERRGPPQVAIVSRSYPQDLTTLRSIILARFKDGHSAPHGLLARPLEPSDSFGTPGDLLLEEPTFDQYWLSEYWSAGQPVKFRCGFLLHLEEQGPSATEVQVVEKAPEVWVGEHWALEHHGLDLGRVHDIRFVEPTIKDRLEMLDVIGQPELIH